MKINQYTQEKMQKTFRQQKMGKSSKSTAEKKFYYKLKRNVVRFGGPQTQEVNSNEKAIIKEIISENNQTQHAPRFKRSEWYRIKDTKI